MMEFLPLVSDETNPPLSRLNISICVCSCAAAFLTISDAAEYFVLYIAIST